MPITKTMTALRRALIFTVAALGSLAAHAATIDVNSDADAPNTTLGATDKSKWSCSAGASNVCTLRAAVMLANALSEPSKIILHSRTYALTIPGRDENVAATGDLDITGTADLEIVGDGADLTIINGGSVDRIFHFLGKNNVTLNGLAITGGSVITDGGGLYNAFAYVTLKNCKVYGNSAKTTTGTNSGGGVYNGVGTKMTITNCTIGGTDKNAANIASPTTTDSQGGFYGGGGVYNAGDMTINDSYISNNKGRPWGGGVLNVGTLTVNRSVVDHNLIDVIVSFTGSTVGLPISTTSIVGAGGGLMNAGGAMTLNKTLVTDNSAAEGGGVFNYNAANTTAATYINSSHITNNTAGFSGGGIGNYGTMEVRQSAITNNAASVVGFGGGDGGGINNMAQGAITVQNSTIANNTATRSGGGISSGHVVNYINVTSVYNQSGVGREIYIRTDDTNTDKVTLLNSIIGAPNVDFPLLTNDKCAGGLDGAADPAFNKDKTLFSQGHNIEFGNSCALIAATPTIPTSDLSNTDPRLNLSATATDGELLLSNTYPPYYIPKDGSPAIDALSVCPSPRFDQRLFGRPGTDPGVDPTKCDIGAIEAHAVKAKRADLKVSLTPSTTGPIGTSDSITYTIVVTNDGPDVATSIGALTSTFTGSVTLLPVSDADVICSVDATKHFVCTLPALAPGASKTIYLKATPALDFSGNHLLHTLTITPGVPDDPFPGNNTISVDNSVISGSVGNNFGKNGKGGALGMMDLALFAVPALLVWRRRRVH